MSHIPYARALGLRLESAGAEGVRLRRERPHAAPGPDLPSVVVLLGMIDQACAMAAYLCRGEGYFASTVDLHVEFQPAHARVDEMGCEARVAHGSEPFVVTQAEVIDARSGASLAVARALCALALPGERSPSLPGDDPPARAGALLAVSALEGGYGLAAHAEVMGSRARNVMHGGAIAGGAWMAAGMHLGEPARACLSPLLLRFQFLRPSRMQRLELRPKVLKSGKRMTIVGVSASQADGAHHVMEASCVFGHP